MVDADRYEAYYTERLWALLPTIYRTLDAGDLGRGPLRELVERLGRQIAVVRRSIDRGLEDQSIESCDDWLIPYIGDLLATRIVAGLDARGQRLDVAKTIYYRRRKGTVAVLEELAADITGWDARVVEFFRRLGRTRHGFDPPIGVVRSDAVLAGLVGTLSGTPAGGFADLRNRGAGEKTQTAFDEYAHYADFRFGRDGSGWHGISKLGVFLWRLRSYRHALVTPVPSKTCPGQFTFDPTGREIPLFAREFRDPSQYGDAWVTPDQWMLPGPIDAEMLRRESIHLYPASLAVVDVFASGPAVVPLAGIDIDPERGRFEAKAGPAPGGVRLATYHHGFSSEIGGLPYDRRALALDPLDRPDPIRDVRGGGNGLRTAMNAQAGLGTIEVTDSLTYTAVSNPWLVSDALVQGAPNERPTIRLTGKEWVIEGTDAILALEGVLFSGVDLVLRGTFRSVTVSCSTLDPGESLGNDGKTPKAIDGRPLVPTTLWIEGSVDALVVRRSVVGPVRTRKGGFVRHLSVADSIVQAVRTPLPSPEVIALEEGDVALARTTAMGRVSARRIEASESILLGLATAEDSQSGCVRFCAYAEGSRIHQPYESVVVRENASLFSSQRFGEPGFGQLAPWADREIVDPVAGGSILSGAEDGSEMGAFRLERNPIKERGLRLKLNEYMPVGMTPVLIFVT